MFLFVYLTMRVSGRCPSCCNTLKKEKIFTQKEILILRKRNIEKFYKVRYLPLLWIIKLTNQCTLSWNKCYLLYAISFLISCYLVPDRYISFSFHIKATVLHVYEEPPDVKTNLHFQWLLHYCFNCLKQVLK